MPNSVSNAFRSKLETSVVNSVVMRMIVGLGDYSTKVTRYPVIAREIGRVVAEDVTVGFVRNDADVMNIVTSKAAFNFDFSQYDFGFMFPTGSLDLLTMFRGVLTSARSRDDETELAFSGVLDRMRERNVGTEDSVVSFENVNPSDMAWSIVTSYGGLDSTESPSNPEINYSAWSSWHAGFDNDSVLVSGVFDGQSVLEALQKIADLTDSTAYGDGDGKLVFARWIGVMSVHGTVTDSFIIGDVEVEVDQKDIINNARIMIDYDPFQKIWWDEVTTVNSDSIDRWGLHERIYDDTNVWYMSEAVARIHGERVVYRRANPNTIYNMQTPVRFLLSAVGDVVAFTSEKVNVASKYLIVQKCMYDLENGLIKLTLNEGMGAATAPLLRGFILDSPILGLLDKDYNPLI